MAVNIAPSARQQFEDANGNPIVGGKLFTYIAGSTTKQPTFTDSTGGSANTNPIILDASGRTPSGLWLTESVSYKFVLAPATDTDPPTSPIWTEDGITGVNDSNAVTLSQWQTQLDVPTYIGATSFSVPGDKTGEYHVGRRLKSVNTAGVIYSSISNTSFGAGITTVTVVNDSGTLDSGISELSLGLITATSTSIPSTFAKLASPVFTGNPTGPTAAEFDNDTSLATTAFVNRALPNRSHLINGNFAVWQPGEDTVLSTDYTADCWGKHNFQTGRVTKQAFVASGDHPGNSQYVARVGGDGTTDTSRLHIGQGIPLRDTIALRGKTVTLSGYVKFSAATMSSLGSWSANVGYSNSSNDGAFNATDYTATASGSTTIANGSLPITWQKFTVTLAIGASAQNIAVYFQFASLVDKTASDWYDLSLVKLEVGSVATPYVPMSVDDELRLCLPYCEKSFALETAPVQNVGTTTDAAEWRTLVAGAVAFQSRDISFKARKRVAPTVTLFNPSAANAQVRDVSGSVDCSSSSASAIGESGFRVLTTGNAASSANNILAVHWIAKAFL